MTSDMTKSGEIVESAPDRIELQGISTVDLRSRLDAAIGMTERAIRTVAAIWAELTRRGEDLSNIRFSLARFMLPVAEGRLLPKLVVAMSGQTRALSLVADLSVDDQAALVDGRPVEIYRGDDRVETKTLAEMTFAETALVIRDGYIRSSDEQRLAYERAQSAKSKATRRAGRPPRLSITADNILMVGKTAVPVERVLAELRSKGLI